MVFSKRLTAPFLQAISAGFDACAAATETALVLVQAVLAPLFMEAYVSLFATLVEVVDMYVLVEENPEEIFEEKFFSSNGSLAGCVI